MDKPTGNQTLNQSSSGDTTPSSRAGNNSSSCGGNNNIDLGCGLTSSSPSSSSSSSSLASSVQSKSVGGSSTSSAFPSSSSSSPSPTPTPSNTAKTTIPLPLGAPLPASSATSSASSTLQQTTATMPRFVLNGAPNTQQQQHTQHQAINLNINTTTGGNFDVTVDPNVTVESLKKIIAKKLKVSKDRIRLLHRERELQDGSLKDNNLMDGSKIILIPNVETGLLAQRPENTVMQALESLNDSQVNDFLSGKTPLNLSMRLGDHMMLIQLQLSTVNPANGGANGGGGNAAANQNASCASSSRARSSSMRTAARTGSFVGSTQLSNHAHHPHHHHHHPHHHHRSTGGGASGSASNIMAGPTSSVSGTSSSSSVPITMLRKSNADNSSAASAEASVNRISIGNSSPASTSPVIKGSDLSSFLSKRDYESLQNIVKSIAMTQPARLAAAASASLSAQNLSSTPNPTPTASHVVTNSQMHQTAATIAPPAKSTTNNTSFPASAHTEAAILEQSPIKSLSNLVSSSPIETTTPTATAATTPIKNIPSSHVINGSSSTAATQTGAASVTPMLSCQDPIAAKLTSCLCTRLQNTSSNGIIGAAKNCIDSSCLSRGQEVAATPPNGVLAIQPPAMLVTSTPNKAAAAVVSSASAAVNSPLQSSAATLHKTANNPIMRSKHRHHHHHHHHHYHQNNGSGGGNAPSSSTPIVRPKQQPISSVPRCTSSGVSNLSTGSNDSGFASDDSGLKISTTTSHRPLKISTTSSHPAPAPPPAPSPMAAPVAAAADDSGIMVTDTRNLAEASRNLTQTLRKLSKEVFTNKIDLSSAEDLTRKNGTGAVIESMKNHGKGIYSGTFSGTLNPALQDRYGRPKRDISTVIHILNDLLSATPQYSRGARISFESPSTSSSASTSAGAALANGSRCRQFQVKHAHSHNQSCFKCLKAHTIFGQHSSSNGSTANNSNTNTNTSSSSNNSSSVNCAYGECNGHYNNSNNNNGSCKNIIRTTNYACCSNAPSSNGNGSSSSSSSGGATNATGHHHHHHSLVESFTNMNGNDRNVCSCRFRNNPSSGGESVEREREHTCQKCLSEMEMLRTKSKLDQLRLVMQQRKQKREARKLNSAPYGARVVGGGTSTTATTSNIGGNSEISEAAKSSTTVAAAAALATSTATSLKNSTSASSSSSSSSTNSSSTKLASSAPPSEVSPNHIVEEVDTAA